MPGPLPDHPSRREFARYAPTHEDALFAFLEAPEEPDVSTDHDGTSLVQLDAPVQEPVPAQLLDLCIQGASVMVSEKETRALEWGSVLGLRLEHRRDSWELRTDAIVRSIRGEGIVRLGLEFHGAPAEELVEAAGQYFNRRRAQRVDLGPAGIEGGLELNGARLPLRAHDLSVHGIAVRVPRQWCESIRMSERGTLSLELSDGGGPFQLPVVVVRSRLFEGEELASLSLMFPEPARSSDSGSLLRLETFVRRYLTRRLCWAA